MKKQNHAKTFAVTALSTVMITTTSTPSVSALVTRGHDAAHLHASALDATFVPAPADAPQILLAGSGGAVTEATTNAVVDIIRDANRECKGAGDAYAASCLAQDYKKAALRASNPDYYEARRTLKSAARKLDRLASANADRKAPKKRGKFGSYKAVKAEAVASVKRDAVKIVEETRTKLLRSTGNDLQKIHYKRIAQAVNSNKVIFRS